MPPYVNEDTKIYSSTVYTRGSSKRTFGFVIKGMIISATLLSPLTSTDGRRAAISYVR